MGRPKEALPFADEPLLARTARTLLGCASPVVVVARGATQELPPLPAEVHVLHDSTPDAGPLAALATGLRWLSRTGFADDDAAFATACDLPFLSAAAVQHLAALAAGASLAMPRTAETLHPLAAVYRLSVLPFAELLLARGVASPRDLASAPGARIADEAALRTFDPELRFLRNVNTPDEYRAALDDWRKTRQ